MEQRGPCIGIDLGTAYTRVASFDGNQMKMIPDQYGESAMPSYVAFTDSGVLIGRAARTQAPQNPTNTIFDVIRLIGRHYSDPSVHNDMRFWPFKVVASPDDTLQVEVRLKGKLCQFTPVEICSMILTQIKENAQATLEATIIDAAVTVPVLFNYQQRQAIKEAGMIAGLNILQIVSSPAATALFYGMERLSRSPNMFNSIRRTVFWSDLEEHNVIIFDLEAGTLDVAVVTIRGNDCRVRATAGDVHLGGADFDNNLVDHFVNSLKQSGREDISCSPIAKSNLRTLCENAKISLSSGSLIAPMKITPLYSDVNLDSSITEAEFIVLNIDLFKKCIRLIEMCLIDASISIDTVHEVILAGSSTRIPTVQNYLNHWFQGKNLTISQNLEVATSYGVACQAFFLSRRVNRRGHRLSLKDATPFTLGIKVPRGSMFVFVPKNTNIPFKMEGVYRFTRSSFVFEVYEGDETMVHVLGKFEHSGVHIAQNRNDIKICFEMLENGILKVVAEDISTGRRNGMDFTMRNIEDSKRRVREVLHCEESEKSRIEASTTKSLTRSGTSKNWERLREKPILGKLLTMNKDKSEKIMGQSSRQYVEPDEYAIGIDFGTTHSSVAVWQRNGVKVIENEYGIRYTSSVVAFTDTCRLIGDTVHKEQVTTNPTNIIPNIKSLIGRCCSDQSYHDQSVHDNAKLLPFRVICDDKKRYMVSVHYKNEEKLFAPEEIAATILSKMKEIAEAHLNSKVPVSKAVISVPSSFNNFQRNAIKNAAAIAGLDVLQLLNETTAAAIAYFVQKVGGQNTSEKTLLIFDLGGGNLDVSIVKIKRGSICVQAVVGETNLGGEDFDNNMVSYCVAKFMKDKNKDIHNKSRSLRRLRAACEKSKRTLSTNGRAMVQVDALYEDIDFHSVITRKEFEELNDILFKKSISCVERCLEDAMIEKSIVDEVVLVGGSTRIPKMQQVLQEFFNGKELCKSINADEAVVYGAAVQAAILGGNEDRKNFNILELQDVTSWSFGLDNKDGVVNMLIPKHTPIPSKKELIFTTSSDHLSIFLMELQEFESASRTMFSVSGITPKPRGSSRICLSFDVDDSGILNVTGKDVSSRGENEIVISEDSGGLTTQEIKKMAEAAARYKAEDEEQKARVTALLSLENLAYKIKALASNLRGPASYKKSMEGVTDKVLDWLDINHNAEIDHINNWNMRLEAVKISLEDPHRVWIDAFNSLENLANKIKAIAKDPGVPVASKKSMKKAADDAIAFLETNYDATIDEINAWKGKLETIISKIVYLGTSATS